MSNELMNPTENARSGAPAPVTLCSHSLSLSALALAVMSAATLVLGGCASSAGIASRAQVMAPAQVGLSQATGPAGNTAQVDAAWWTAFGDPQLNSLIERALSQQPSLHVAQARLARASAALGGAQASEGIQVNGSVDVTRQRFSATSIYPPPLGGSVRTLATAQLGASWEFDFFGRNRAAIEAALGAEHAAQADLQAARSLLATQVARTHVQLARLQAQRAVAVDTLKQRQDTLGLIQQRVRSGLDTTVELRQGEASLPEMRQQIEQYDEQIGLTRHALAALSAQPIDALDGLDVPLRSLQLLPLPAAVPADLLGRRADLDAARWRVEAATSDMQAARAQFYPNINLVAFAGLSSIGLDRLLNADSRQYGAGPALRLPVFDAGRLRANLRGKAADLDAAIESYNSTLLDAVHDTADQLGSLRSIARQQAEQASALVAAESAHALALQRYKAGLSTYLVVLNAEASVLNQRRLGTDLKARAIDTQIALIRALGGGYQAAADTRSAAAPAAAAPTTAH